MQLLLQTLRLTQFKNYAQQTLECSPGLNAFVGLNGMGKTNLLDAIYYLCMAKSHFQTPDSQIVMHGTDFFRLDGQFNRNGKAERIVAKVQPRRKKVIERNTIPYTMLSAHIGLLPVVFIAPDDTLIISQGSEIRRRFMNNTLSQINPQYLAQLIRYNRLLQQRNKMLKKWGDEGGYDKALLHVYDQQLVAPTSFIHQCRLEFTQHFLPHFNEFHQRICGQQEQVGLTYASQLDSQPLLAWLEANAEKDRYLQRTSAGIHKDDLKFAINGNPLKRFASQGQLKSFVLALKLAQYQLLKSQSQINTLLLLDDIFDKLDARRVTQLLELLMEGSFGQTFITDTHEERMANIIRGIDTEFKLFLVHQGQAQSLQS